MRLATFNILHGRSLRDGVVDLHRLTEAIRILDPDILALQEVDRDQPRSQLADLTAVAAEAMGAVTHRFAAALSGTPGATWIAATENDVPGTAAYGIALLSRYPARSWQVLHLPRIPVRFPFYLTAPRKMIMVNEEPRAVVIGAPGHPGRSGGGGQHPPVLRAGLGPVATAADPPRPGRGERPGGADG